MTDDRAADLCGDYAAEGVPAFFLRTLPGGDVRFIGPKLPGKLVASMLRSAAKAIEDQLPDGTIN